MVGQLQAGEVDFVCTKPGDNRVYIQASFIIADDSTREREFGNLHAIKDNYPKYVISMTPLLSKADDNGVTHIHLRKFLKEGLSNNWKTIEVEGLLFLTFSLSLQYDIP